jgi:hypothetical protein
MHSLTILETVALGVLALVITACASSPDSELESRLEWEVDLQGTIQALETELDQAQAEPVDESYPFEGMWVTESEDISTTGQILVITKEHFYQVATFTAQGSDVTTNLMEMFATIEAVDPGLGHIELKVQWFRNNGKFGGFDYPIANVVYEVSGDTLRIAIQRTGDSRYPELPDPLPYYRQ